jgi:hypothetical protein
MISGEIFPAAFFLFLDDILQEKSRDQVAAAADPVQIRPR